MRLYLVVLLALSNFVSADVIHFINGDRLSGNVVEMKKDKLEFNNPAMGTLSIDWNSVRTLETNAPYPIDLKSGSTIIGLLKPVGDKEKVVEIESNGKEFKTSLPLDSIQTINTRQDVWTNKIAFGYSDLNGNTNKTTVNTSLHSVRPFSSKGVLKNQITVQGSINYSRSNGETNERKGRFEGKFDSFIHKNLNWYFSETLSYNYQQDLQLRAVESLGVEYTFYKKNNWTIKPLVAISRLDSFYTDDAVTTGDGNYFSISPGLYIQWTPWKEITLSNKTTIAPNIRDLEDYVFDCHTSLSIPLIQKLSLLMSYNLSITSQPPEDVDRKDQTTTVSFGYTF